MTRLDRTKHTPSPARLSLSLLGLVATLAAAGCGRGIAGYCEDAATCEFGNDADVEACIIRFEEREDLADLYNCNDEFADYFDCLDEFARCDGERYRPPSNRCDTQRDRLNRCIDD